MAIQPIDLQALFSQIDKVGKEQSAQRDGLAAQQAILGAEIQRKTEENIQSVNKAQNTGEDGTEKVKDRKANNQENSSGEKKENKQQGQEEKSMAQVIRDPSLGKKIDISL